jgi:transcriptional regulator with XRE-family HTH domain
MSDALRDLVNLKMKKENLSLRKAGIQAGVAHTTIDRVCKGESVDLETVQKISDWVGVPVSTLVDIGEVKSPMLDDIAVLFSLNDEFAEVFTEVAKRIKAGELSPDFLTEITAFTTFRMDLLIKRRSKKNLTL